MVQKYFTGRPSCVAEKPCEKVKRQLGLASQDNPLLPSCKEATESAIFFPACGNGNGTSWNNRGANGNYWSSSWNSARNARNLNFNPSGVNPQNTNNRFNGFALRAVQQSLCLSFALFFLFIIRLQGSCYSNQ